MYNIVNVVAQVDSLHSLTLTDVELDPIRSVRKNYAFERPNFSSIIFEDVGVKVLNDFFRLSKENYFEFIAIVRSQVDSLRRMAPSHSLLLKDLIGED
ncbi:hypothetical protein SERLADRAFT_458513 [Serpula lacrymans var. lacrymans S7.9]|uniref:Uncharacterized protein n=1 Tax=Serpula lacrymans var. lacrymans (strain S7.9) TaxID=578457 RepID=F8NJI9_SERL9|nr:uncharacterized protein SERLADRAFT_458513 [Serpula lacrymans var. lacrymans S7.9]EGO30039.1 hypothetical protein SERLADRAFT_458513 [Serpula lacrymans var. lacrymans S7.9]